MSFIKKTLKSRKRPLFFIFLITSALILSACSEEEPTKKKELTNKEKAVQLVESIESGDKEPVLFINSEKYTQHNLAVADGIEGFTEVLSMLPKGTAKAKVVRAIEDGNYVVTHTDYNFFGDKVGFDIFRFENGKIVEHWDNLQEKEDELNPSGRTQLDGDTTIVDIEKTEENKKIVSNFIQDILIGGKMDKITTYIGEEKEDYLQHNPSIGDGLQALGQAMARMASENMPMVYSKNHIILGEGNFVLAVSEGEFINEPASFYDLFRLKDGKIVEHWDSIETIPPKDEWKNKNGKFNFPK